MSIAKVVEGLTVNPTGIGATIKQFVSGMLPNRRKNNEYAGNSPPDSGTPVIKIDEGTISYLLSLHYQRPYSFTVVSSDARQNAPGLYERIEALRNEDGNKLILQLVGDRFSAMAESTFNNIGHDLRVSMVSEQRSGSIYSSINTHPSS